MSEHGMDINSFVGPWTYEFETEDGELIRLGYEAPTVQEYPERWDAEYDAHVESQEYWDKLDRRCGKALRDERYSNLLRWVARAPRWKLGGGRRQLTRAVQTSRRHCASTFCWHGVALNKMQYETLQAALKLRMGIL